VQEAQRKPTTAAEAVSKEAVGRVEGARALRREVDDKPVGVDWMHGEYGFRLRLHVAQPVLLELPHDLGNAGVRWSAEETAERRQPLLWLLRVADVLDEARGLCVTDVIGVLKGGVAGAQEVIHPARRPWGGDRALGAAEKK